MKQKRCRGCQGCSSAFSDGPLAFRGEVKEQQVHKSSIPGRGEPWLQTREEVVWRSCIYNIEAVSGL